MVDANVFSDGYMPKKKKGGGELEIRQENREGEREKGYEQRGIYTKRLACRDDGDDGDDDDDDDGDGASAVICCEM